MRKCLIIPMPVSPIERLTAQFRNYLHLPDPSALYILMGAVAANMIEGTPVWLMLVGPPSCGKTELLNSLLHVPGFFGVADIASEAAFLSATAKRDRASDATGGILRQIGAHGGLIINDFTSILSKPHDMIATIMSVFRETYSGMWTRHVGGEGGRALTWAGKLTILAGVTGKIDLFHQMSAELGERWIYFRFEYEPGDDHWAETQMALSNRPTGWREELRDAVAKFWTSLDMSFGKKIPRRDFTDYERMRLHELSTMAVHCRSGVAREGYSREVMGSNEQELAVRLSTVLGQLFIGMDIIGVPERTRWKLVAQIAFDSMPRLRKLIIHLVAKHNRSVEDLRRILGSGPNVTKRVVEDLELHGVVERVDGMIQLTEWMRKSYKRLVP